MRKILRGHVFYKIFLFTLCLGFSFLFEAHAQVYTINPGAAVSPTNFHTFTAAVAKISTGITGPVTINVAAGTGPYTEQLVINAIPGASSTNTITFNCNGVTLNFLSTDESQRACIKLDGADYVTFDNLTVEPQAINYGEYGYGFHLLNDADYNTIKNCHINVNQHNDVPEFNEGIVINGNHNNSIDPGASNCDHNVVEGNTISGGSVGISLSSAPDGGPVQLMLGNRIANNHITNFYYYAIQLFYNDGAQIDGNEITGGNYLYYSSGIYIAEGNQSLAVVNNRIHDFWCDEFNTDSELAAILMTNQSVAGKELLIANNLIYDFRSGGLQMGIASRYNDGSFFNIYNNTISFDDQTIEGTETYGIYFEEVVSDVNVMNNIITITRQTSGSNFGFNIAQDPTGLQSDNNVYYIPAVTSNTCAVGVYGGNDIELLSDWQRITKFDLFSTDVNPAYASLAGFNFRPTAGGVDNMAVAIGAIGKDITNANRNATNPDPGCYEFNSAPCASLVTAGTTFVTPDSVICLGPKITLGARGNSSGAGQTYTWQTSATPGGVFTDVTGALAYPRYEVTPSATMYYRVAITCGGTTAHTSPVRVLVTTALNPGTYTINAALPTGGVNFSSFADAVSAMQCGINGSIVFNVASENGPYNEQLILPALGTSANKTITFNGNGATIAYVPGTNNRAVIDLNDADYITIDSLNVELLPAATFGYGIHLINNADHNTIKRCSVNVAKSSTSTSFVGIVINGDVANPTNDTKVSDCDSNLVINSTITGGYYGISCVSKTDGTDLYAKGNSIIKNKFVDNSVSGIYIAGQENLVVDSNDISQPTRTVFPNVVISAIKVLGKNYGLAITKNRIHNLSEKATIPDLQLDGITFNNVSTVPDKPTVVTNNVIYQFKGNGLQNGIYTISSNYLKLYHNTISLDDTISKPFNGVVSRGFAMFGTIQPGNEFKDNIITIKRGGAAHKYGIYVSGADNITSIDYNNIYVSSNGTGRAYAGYLGGSSYTTLADWMASGKDAHSISMDPVYNDLARGDLTPTKIPFENKGTNVGIVKDIVDVERDVAKPDIGAVEFTICRQLTTPAITADSIGVNVVRFSWPDVEHTAGFRVSRDGVNWTIPSSGARGLTHTIAGLKPAETVQLVVKALGARVDCPDFISQAREARTLTDGVYVPNTFTPNGNSQNETFKVYSNIMRSIRWMVFNQWGEKVFETADLQGEWNGTYKGKPQPVGVYIYVLTGTLPDGTKISQKGTFNLIR